MAVADASRDDELLARLGRIVEAVDPVPEHVLELGRAAYSFRLADAELMQVITDSSEAVGVRAGTTSRMYFFELPSLTLDVEVTTRGELAAVIGIVASEAREATESTDAALARDSAHSGAPSVTVETPGATFVTEPDPEGRFEFEGVPTGLMRVRLLRPSGAETTTPWFEPA